MVTVADAVALASVLLLVFLLLLFLQLLRRVRRSHVAPDNHNIHSDGKGPKNVCVCVLCLRQPLQEHVVERLLAAAAARHAEQQWVSEQRRSIGAAARAVVPVVGAFPQVERQQHLLRPQLRSLLRPQAQLIPGTDGQDG